MASLEVRLREPSVELLSLPWRRRLAEWDVTRVAFRDVPVGPSRHLVRFVEADGRLWALKDLPRRIALHEYEVLRAIEARELTAVRAAGVVLQPEDSAILVTHYLERSWQYRRLLMRVPWAMAAHRARLFDAMAALLVDLHRSGVYWGDCSLANTLFRRDGQRIEAWMVDAETAEYHPVLSDGQRQADLEIVVENVAGGLLDVAARREEPPESLAAVFDEARSVVERYQQLWDLLHHEPVMALSDTAGVGSRVRSLEEAGFSIDEVRLESASADEPSDDQADGPAEEPVRVRVAVGGRRFHSGRLRALTGLSVGEGQAEVLMRALLAHRDRMERELGRPVSEQEAARHWMDEVYRPGAKAAHQAVGGVGDRAQAYCDLLEVRWLLSEQAGHDVGDEPALEALARRATPGGSAANMAFVEMPTAELPAIEVDPSEGDDA